MHHRITRKISFILMIATLSLVLAAALFTPSASVYATRDLGASISIPSIGVQAPVVRIGIRAFPNGEVTWDTSGLTTQVGHLEGMAWFGQSGNIVLGGHSELANRVPTVFYDLEEVAVGDEVIITQGSTTWRYVVTDTFEVSYRDLSILYPTTTERLTIITCALGSFSGSSYSRRTVVIAERAQ